MEIQPLGKEPCEAAALPPLKSSEVDYQVFGVRQTAQLVICEYKRRLNQATMELHNIYVERLVKATKPATFWDRVTNKKLEPPPKPTIEQLLGLPEVPST